MGFLDSLGSGLRYGGSALAGAVSPDVYREQAHERGRVKESGRDRQSKAAEIMLQAAHSGQIPDEHLPELQQSLKRMGYDLPIEALSPSPDARQKLSEYARIKSEREKSEAAGTELANFGQPEGLGLPEQGLRGGAPAPLPQVPMPPRPGASLGLQGMPTPPDQSANPPGVQTFPLAPPDPQKGTPSPDERLTQDQIDDMDSASDSPDYPPQMMPPVPRVPVAVKDGEIPTLSPVESVELRQKDVSRGTIPPIVQNEIAQAIPQGTSKVDLQEWRKRALNAARRGVPGAKEELEHVLKLMNPGKSELITVGKGQTIYDPRTGKAVFHGAPEEIKEVAEFKAFLDEAGIVDPKKREEEFAKYVARKGSGSNTHISFGGLTAGVDANGNPVFAQSSNKGGAQIVEGFKPPPKEAKPLTESQANATAFGMRANKAHATAIAIEATSTEVGTMAQHIKEQTGTAGNYTMSDDMQRYRQAKEEFINAAVLRKDSGAAIADSEYAKYNRIFFPQAGDKPGVIEQKRLSRESVVEGLMIGAGEGGRAAQANGTGKPTSKPETMTVPSGKHKGEYFKKDGEWLKK